MRLRFWRKPAEDQYHTNARLYSYCIECQQIKGREDATCPVAGKHRFFVRGTRG